MTPLLSLATKPTRGLLDQTPNFKMSSLPVGTTVKLEGLSSAEYNGKKGRVAVTAQDVIARGRIAVVVDGATLSFKRANVRRYFPSDDSDESDEEDEAAPPPPKRAAGGTFVLTILTGWSSIETSTIVGTCVEINQCVGCILAPSSGEEPASPRHRAGVASMAWRTTR